MAGFEVFTEALFALGSMLIFLIGIPRLRYFFVAALILGFGIALILRFIHRETPGKPWILSAHQDADSPTSPVQGARSNRRPESKPQVIRELRCRAVPLVPNQYVPIP